MKPNNPIHIRASASVWRERLGPVGYRLALSYIDILPFIRDLMVFLYCIDADYTFAGKRTPFFCADGACGLRNLRDGFLPGRDGLGLA